jgi:SHS2 domain-containing protein
VAAPDPAGGAATGHRRFRFRGDVAIADVAFEAEGTTLGDLFAAAADATASVMCGNLEAIEDRVRRAIRLEEQSADLLLYRFLEELVYLKDTEGLMLRVPAVRIHRRDGAFVLEAEARGEPLDPPRHLPRADVKAVTLHRLRVEGTGSGWEASVVLDI